MSIFMETALDIIAKSSIKQGLPEFKVGQTVRIHQRIKEGNKERIQVFEGIIIKTSSGSGVSSTITVRKIVDGVGVERVYATHSPNIAKIEIIKEAKIRRSKLYYMRERTGKAARLKTTLLEGQIFTPKAHTEEEAADPTEEERVPAEEAPAEEAPAPTEEPAEEAPAPADEPVEKKPAEEAPVEEAAPAEEKPAEEAPAEETAPAEEPAEEEK